MRECKAVPIYATKVYVECLNLCTRYYRTLPSSVGSALDRKAESCFYSRRTRHSDIVCYHSNAVTVAQLGRISPTKSHTSEYDAHHALADQWLRMAGTSSYSPAWTGFSQVCLNGTPYDHLDHRNYWQW